MDNASVFYATLGVFVGVSMIFGILYLLKDILNTCWPENRVAPSVTSEEPALELNQITHEEAPIASNIPLYLPSYEEATSGQPRRRRISPKENVPLSSSGRDETGTQLAGKEASSERYNREGGNGGEFSGTSTRNTGDDSGVRVSFEDNSDMNMSSRDGGNTSTANDSGVTFGGSEDTVDKFDVDSIVSQYDTASEGGSISSGGRDSMAPLPWSSF